MVNRVDGAVRTTAQKPFSASREDGRLRTASQKDPSNFIHSQAVVVP